MNAVECGLSLCTKLYSSTVVKGNLTKNAIATSICTVLPTRWEGSINITIAEGSMEI